MGRKFLSELHDPNHRKAEGQKGELLTEDEAEQRFDAMIAKLDAEDRAAHDASCRRAVGKQVRSTDGRVDGGRESFQGQTETELGELAARCHARLAARPLYESADQRWMIRLFPLI